MSWSGATDNVAVTSYDVYKDGAFLINVASSPYTAVGLTPNTAYTFYVKAKDAAGNASANSNTVNVTTLADSTIISTKFNIEGYYDILTHAMRPVRANQGIGVSATDVDNVTLELRNAASPYELVATTTAMLQTNGTVVGTFNSAINGNFYLVLKHRNAVQTWSANPIVISSSTPLYDFTDNTNKAYGNNMIEMETNVWAFYSGDIDQDESVDPSDYSLWEIDANLFSFGNFVTDLNGDGAVDPSDYSIWEINSNNFAFSLHP